MHSSRNRQRDECGTGSQRCDSLLACSSSISCTILRGTGITFSKFVGPIYLKPRIIVLINKGKNPQEPTGPPKSISLNHPLPRGSQNPPKIDPAAFQKAVVFFDWFWNRALMAFGPNLVPTWKPKSFPNGSKLDQKQVRPCTDST